MLSFFVSSCSFFNLIDSSDENQKDEQKSSETTDKVEENTKDNTKGDKSDNTKDDGTKDSDSKGDNKEDKDDVIDDKTEEGEDEIDDTNPEPLTIQLDSHSYTIGLGESKQLSFTYKGGEISNPVFYWISSNPSIASVSSSGLIKGLNEGSCEVSVFYDVNKNYLFEESIDIFAKARVNVTNDSLITSSKDVTYYSSYPKGYAESLILPSDKYYNVKVKINTINKEGEVPYISFDELTKLYSYQLGYFKQSSLSGYPKLTTENNKYRLDLVPNSITMNGSKRVAPLYFDVLNNKITCADYTKFTSITDIWNNGLPNDMCSPYGIVSTSTKSKVINSPSETVFDLSKYNIHMYQINGVAYIPLHLALSLPSEFSSYYYDGTLICEPREFEGKYFSYLYSGKTRFSIHLPGDALGLSAAESFYTFYQSPDDSNTYSFSFRWDKDFFINGKAEFKPTTNRVTFTCSANPNENVVDYKLNGLANVTYNYVKNDDLITLTNTSDGSIAHYIRLVENDIDNTGFKDNMKVFNYNYLVFKLDYFYGLRNRAIGNISFDYAFKTAKVTPKDYLGKYFKSTDTTYNLLMSCENTDEYNTMLYYIIHNYLGDGHTNMLASTSSTNYSYLREYLLKKVNLSSRKNGLQGYYTDYMKSRKNSNGLADPSFIISGETAIIQFDSFNGRVHTAGNYAGLIDSFEKLKDKDNYARNYRLINYQYDTLTSMYYAFYVIKQKSQIKNIVFDVTNNGGGAVLLLPQLLAFMTKDPTVLFKDTNNGFLGEYHYNVDLNGDGTSGNEGDTYEGQYNFFVLQSEFSFSCGTAFPTVCKNNGCAKIIGSSNSGGGACPVSYGFDTLGSQYQISGRYNIMLKNGDGTYIDNDNGVPADKTLDSKYWYDYSYINTWISNNF